MTTKWFPLLGLGFAVAGADKLLGMRAYERLFANWGWSESTRQIIGACEFLGGVLVASQSFRHLGGWLLTSVSTAMLTAEMDQQQKDLALPRSILLLAAASALLPVGHRRRPTPRPTPRTRPIESHASRLPTKLTRAAKAAIA